MKKKVLKSVATIISLCMIFVCLTATVIADEVNDTEPSEQTDVEPEEETEPSESEEETEPSESSEETEPVEPSDETVPSESEEEVPAEPSETEDIEEDTDLGFCLVSADLIEVSSYSGLTEAIAQISDRGTVRLVDNIDTSGVVEIANRKNITLDLNGYTLNRGLSSPQNNGHVIAIRSSAKLTICDSQGTGLITGGYANIGGGIYNDGELWIEGGTISGNCAFADEAGGRGGGIYNNNFIYILEGTISGNSSDDAGGIINDSNGTIAMCDITISNNRSVNHGGGGIVNYGRCSLSGNCNITGNTAASNGGGIWNNGNFGVYGRNYVTNNVSGTGADNLYLKAGTRIYISEPISGEIGVSTENPVQTITSGWSDRCDINIIKSDTGIDFTVVNGELESRSCYINRYWSDEQQTVISEAVPFPSGAQQICDEPEGGWYYVSGNLNLLDGIKVPKGSTVNLILEDGCQLTCNHWISVPQGSTLNIYGQQNDSGVLCAPAIGGNSEGPNGKINIYGGTINANGSLTSCTAGIGSGNCGGVSGIKAETEYLYTAEIFMHKADTMLQVSAVETVIMVRISISTADMLRQQAVTKVPA